MPTPRTRSTPARTTPARHRRPGAGVSAKGQERLAAVLDAATGLLVEEGYAQLSLRKVAARADMRLGNLQYYYRTKQDVIRALLERHLDHALAVFERRIATAGTDPRAQLLAGTETLIEALDSDASCRLFWELWALAARDRSVAQATRAFYERYVAEVAEALCAVSPSLRPALAGRRAALVVALLEGLSVLRLGAGGALARGIVDEARALVLQMTEEEPT